LFKWYGWVNFTPYTKVSEFANYLRGGYIMGSKCKKCGFKTFPPRADCPECMSSDFEYVEYSGKGVVHTFTTIAAAPTGFEDKVPYTVGLVDLEGGGRMVAWFGDTFKTEDIVIGMEVQAVPRISGESEDIKLYITLERPGASWKKMPLADIK
jgi:uncharacterized OB-fold protein